jgi:putative ABC transport system permease protein
MPSRDELRNSARNESIRRPGYSYGLGGRKMLRLFLALNAWYAHRRGRTVLSVAGIALGVALGFGVHLVNRAAVGELAAAVRTAAGEADLEVKGGRAGFADEVYARIARVPGVALASPALEAEARVAGSDRTIRLIGIDAFRAAPLRPELFVEDPQRLLRLVEPDNALLSEAAAQALSLRPGDRLAIVVGVSSVELRVADVLPTSIVRGVAALTDIATAQWRLGRVGELNRVDVRLAPGASLDEVRERIGALLPAGVFVTPVQAAEEASATPSRAYRVNLNVLAMVALFTGGFLVFSAQALEVARRRGEHALLRVVGLERRGVVGLVLLDAAAIGAAGSGIGLALGYGLAVVAVRTSGADLGAGMFRGLTPAIVFPGLAAAGYFAAGVAIALFGALLPAIDAARNPPARALKAGDEQRMFAAALSPWPGLALVAAGAALTRFAPVDGVPVFGYLSIASLLIGGVTFMPWMADGLLARLPPLPAASASALRAPWALAVAQLRGAPGQTIVSVAAIVASFALMVSMAIMVASFRKSVEDWLGAVLPADLYFRTTQAGETVFLDPQFETAVRSMPEVARAEFLRSGKIVLDPRRPAVSLLARDLPPGREENAFPRVGDRYERTSTDPPPIWVSEAMIDLYRLAPGRYVVLPLGGRGHKFVVAGVWRDYVRQHGAILVNRRDYIALTGDRRVNDAALWLSPGAALGPAIDALRRLPGGTRLEIAVPSRIREASLALFDRSFAVTYAIEAVAVLVGLFGLSSSLGAIVLARRREFGVLRHLGMTRSQIAAMLAMEGGLLAALGAAAGLALGGAIGLILVHVVNRQSFHWSMDLHPPYAGLAALAAVLLVLSAITAYLSGREATGMGPVRAVREDW